MKLKEIFGKNRLGTPEKQCVGCRGIVTENNKILLVYEVLGDIFTLPGGGLEKHETPEECCIRELREETGYIIAVDGDALIQINEYYEEYKYVCYYFRCSITGKTETYLTEIERERQLTCKWVDIEKAVEIFSHYNDLADINEEKRRMYFREYTALKEISEQ